MSNAKPQFVGFLLILVSVALLQQVTDPEPEAAWTVRSVLLTQEGARNLGLVVPEGGWQAQILSHHWRGPHLDAALNFLQTQNQVRLLSRTQWLGPVVTVGELRLEAALLSPQEHLVLVEDHRGNFRYSDAMSGGYLVLYRQENDSSVQAHFVRIDWPREGRVR